MADILNKILDHKSVEVDARRSTRSLAELKSLCSDASATLGFSQAIDRQIGRGKPAVISEIKKASPSKGVIREDFDPEQIAISYAMFGATCLSVLTDEAFFMGHDDYLAIAKSVCDLPALRKDFIVDEYQIYESRVIGADAILLIVAALNDTQLLEFSQLAASLDLDVLVEVHDKQELDRALALPCQLVGINNRNLRTFETDLDTTLDLLPHIPENRIVVTESGIHTIEDIDLMRSNNVNTFLVGEAFMRWEEPGHRLEILFGL